MNKKTRYESFDGFVREVAEELRRRGKPLDGWMGAVASVLGPKPLETLASALGIRPGKPLSAGLVASLPILGAVVGVAAGALLMRYLASARTDEGHAAADRLLRAQELYREVTAAALPPPDRQALIDDLFEEVLEEPPG